MAAITDALVARLREARADLRLGTRLAGIEAVGGRYDVSLVGPGGVAECLTVDGVVLAVPTAAASEVLELLGAHDAARILRAMDVASTSIVSLGFSAQGMPDLDRLLPAHGYLIAGPGRGPVRGVTRSSAKFPDRAAPGHELFRVTVRAEDSATDDELLAAARAELRRTLGIDAQPLVEHVQRWRGVMPQYAVGHLDRVREVEDLLAAHPGMVLAGSGFHGLGIPDCVASAQRAADRVLQAAEAHA
jgi:oxygen-dependent protoporphyrinogen oxidase